MNSPFRIYVVEDDEWYGKFLFHQLSLNPDYEVKVFSDARSFLKGLEECPDAVTLDYNLPDAKGTELIKKVHAVCEDVKVIIVSGQDDVQTAVRLLKEGAYDYVMKDQETSSRLFHILQHIRENLSLQQEIKILREEVKGKYDFEKSIIGNSEKIREVFNYIAKAIQTKINVSISGETGTGKELVAKSIHYHSSRSAKPFVAVNVAAIPEDLIESELFGHERGAFTGANTMRIGKFEEADGGTLFLDEIGEFSLNLQSKLLRALQEKEITRVGGNNRINVDVRIITATHRNLSEEVRAGRFREDLFYRLMGLPIAIPALRERGNDILLIAKHLIQEFAKDNKIKAKQLSATAREKLLTHRYPGNVRELKAIIDLAMVMSENEQIESEDLMIHQSDNLEDVLQQEQSLEQYQQGIIQHFLNKYDGNVMLVAEKLQIGKSSIYRYLQEQKVHLPRR